MTCRKNYSCDLCSSAIGDAAEGIGLRWGVGNEIKHVFLTNSEHHLCNRCVAGLREMFVDQMYRELDAAGADEHAKT